MKIQRINTETDAKGIVPFAEIVKRLNKDDQDNKYCIKHRVARANYQLLNNETVIIGKYEFIRLKN